MLAALVVLLRMLGLLCSGHRAVALENVALRQQLSVLRRTVRRPHLRTSDRLFWVLLATAWQDWRTADRRARSDRAWASRVASRRIVFVTASAREASAASRDGFGEGHGLAT